MGRRRYESLKRGELRLTEYFDNYLRWASSPRRRNPNTRSPRVRDPASVRPYGIDFSLSVFVMRPRSIGILAGILTPNNQAEIETPPQPGAVPFRGFSPAKVAIEYGEDSFVVSESRLTRIAYRRYDSLTRASSPYGKATSMDLEFVARDLIREAFYRARPSDKIRRITFSAERLTEYP